MWRLWFADGEAQQPRSVHETVQRELEQRQKHRSNFFLGCTMADLLVRKRMSEDELAEVLDCLKLAADRDEDDGIGSPASLSPYQSQRRDSEIDEATYQSRLKQLVERDPRYAWQALYADPSNFQAWIGVLVNSYFSKELKREQCAMLSLILEGRGRESSVLFYRAHDEKPEMALIALQAAVSAVQKCAPGFNVLRCAPIVANTGAPSFVAVYTPQ